MTLLRLLELKISLLSGRFGNDVRQGRPDQAKALMRRATHLCVGLQGPIIVDIFPLFLGCALILIGVTWQIVRSLGTRVVLAAVVGYWLGSREDGNWVGNRALVTARKHAVDRITPS
jgi:hypothetical protein